MPKPGRTKPVTGVQVRSYAAKAEEFAEAAASDLAAGRNIAATSLAIHAGINPAMQCAVPDSGGEQPGRTMIRCLSSSAGRAPTDVRSSGSSADFFHSRPRRGTSPTTSLRPLRPRRSNAPFDALPWLAGWRQRPVST